MKTKLSKQIESSQKGIDYVDSLVPKDIDVIGAVIEQIKDSKYSPNYVKYHDEEKWVEVWKDHPQSIKANEIGLSWEIAERAMKNNIQEESKKYISDRKAVFIIWGCLVLFQIVLTLVLIYITQK